MFTECSVSLISIFFCSAKCGHQKQSWPPFFSFNVFLFSPQLVDKTITKVIVLVCVCKSSQLLPVSKVDKRFKGGAF